MHLTATQERILADGTPSQRKAMGILCASGEMNGAKRFVRITCAHVSGASYKLIGDPGLEFLEDFARDARVAVPTTVHPLGTDLRRWQAPGTPPASARTQARPGQADGGRGAPSIPRCRPCE